MEEKEINFAQFFPHQSFNQWLSTIGVYNRLLELLSEDEIDCLSSIKVIFISTYSPSSTVQIPKINPSDRLTIINFDQNIGNQLDSTEVLAILLHELGHAFNPEVKGIQGEFLADQFANQKYQGLGIISALNKGVENKWLGFDKEECELRIEQLKKNLLNEDDQEMENDIPLDGLEKFNLD